MARLAEGDRRALRVVFDGLHPLVHRFCRRLLRNEADAEDASQLALEKLFFKVSDFDPKGDALGWALAMAAAECRTISRKQFRRRETSDASLVSHAVDSEAQQGLEREELRKALVEVMGTLKPEDVQTLLAWVDVEPRPAVPGATFRKRLERAAQRLRAAWRARYGLD
jgi:RNA polymerase sigma-70 factor, ECF subfamily